MKTKELHSAGCDVSTWKPAPINAVCVLKRGERLIWCPDLSHVRLKRVQIYFEPKHRHVGSVYEGAIALHLYVVKVAANSAVADDGLRKKWLWFAISSEA